MVDVAIYTNFCDVLNNCCNICWCVGLPTDWTQAELEELVSQFGVITEVRVLYDAVTRKGKGVGFARFESMSSAAMCIGRLNGVTVDGGM